MAYDDMNGEDRADVPMKEMTFDALAKELTSLDAGLAELMARREAVRREINAKREKYNVYINEQDDKFYNLIRSDMTAQAMPDNMTTENIRRY